MPRDANARSMTAVGHAKCMRWVQHGPLHVGQVSKLAIDPRPRLMRCLMHRCPAPLLLINTGTTVLEGLWRYDYKILYRLAHIIGCCVALCCCRQRILNPVQNLRVCVVPIAQVDHAGRQDLIYALPLAVEGTLAQALESNSIFTHSLGAGSGGGRGTITRRRAAVDETRSRAMSNPALPDSNGGLAAARSAALSKMKPGGGKAANSDDVGLRIEVGHTHIVSC